MCSGKGVCVNGTCFCSPHAGGADCSEPICPNECSHNGMCVHGYCECFRGHEGADCSVVSPVGGVLGGGVGAVLAGAGHSQRCGGRCAGICLARCRARLEVNAGTPSAGRQCYAECSRTCLTSCVVQRARDGSTSPEEREVALPSLAENALLPRGMGEEATAAGTGEEVVPETASATVSDRTAASASSPPVTRLEQKAVDELSQLLLGLKGNR
jgi:hypothetical protein